MKEIRETKTIEQTTVKFIANDGKEFTGDNAETECRDYERRLDHEKCEREFEKLNPIMLDFPFADWFACDNECRFYLINVKNKGDYCTILDYFISMRKYMDISGMDEPVNYPCEMLIIKGYEWVGNYEGDIDKLKERLNKTLMILSGAPVDENVSK